MLEGEGNYWECVTAEGWFMHTNHDILGCNGNVKDTHVRIIMCVGLSIITGWKEEYIRASCYLANNFRGVSDMNHGRGDLQPREVLSFHCHLKVLLILFLSAAKIEEWEIHEASGIRVHCHTGSSVGDIFTVHNVLSSWHSLKLLSPISGLYLQWNLQNRYKTINTWHI